MQTVAQPVPKSVVCFSGSRDNYQLAWALAEAGLLETLVTDFYLEPQRIPFRQRLEKRLPKIDARHCPGLSSDQVVTPLNATLDSFLMRTPLASKSRQIRLDRTLGRFARERSRNSGATVFSYSYYAGEAFAPGVGRPPFRFLFQLHPHPATVRKILKEEMVRVPQFATSLQWEHEIGGPEDHFVSLCEESRLANGWVVASSHTRASLVENGVPADQIHVVPYGVEFETFPCRDSAPGANEPFRIIWVGSMTQRKGLSYFLEAIKALPQENLEVVICGNHAVDRRVIEEYDIKSIRVFQGLPTAELTQLMQKCDLFVLPSLAEGFGHAILEAMSSGLPVLTTASTCAPDVMVDGQHGFIVPLRDSGALVHAINWGRAHRSELHRMGMAGAVRARQFTWERFRKGIVKAYIEMVERRLSARVEPDCKISRREKALV